LLFEHMDVDKLLSYEAYKDFSVDDYRMIIDEAMKVAQEVLGPAMQGCVYADGRVRVPRRVERSCRTCATPRKMDEVELSMFNKVYHTVMSNPVKINKCNHFC